LNRDESLLEWKKGGKFQEKLGREIIKEEIRGFCPGFAGVEFVWK
jgi:hypothetical protein